MMLMERAEITGDVQISSGQLFLPGNPALYDVLEAAKSDESGMREVADAALCLMGLGEVLRPGDDPGDIIMKRHEKVSTRDAAVAEQFFHADVAVDGLCGVFLIGLEGSDPDTVPETQMVNNAAMLEHIGDFVEGGPLQERLNEVFVVRPYLDPADRSAWMDYPRHVLRRLEKRPFWELLTAPQREHVESAHEWYLGDIEYINDVFISKLIGESAIDGTPLPTCGVGSREIRLALTGHETEEETTALAQLHDEITRYLLEASVKHESQKVVMGSGLFVPTNQLHRATPYLPHHRRSVVAVKCYPGADQPSPISWQQAQGTEY